MIALAEQAYPPRDAVVTAIPKAHFKLTEPLPDGPNIWWSSDFDGIRIPYAVTRDAVEYYTDRMRTGSGVRKLVYSVRADRRQSFEKEGRSFRDVYVVQMNLEVSFFWSELAALWFVKDRTVVLAARGESRAA